MENVEAYTVPEPPRKKMSRRQLLPMPPVGGTSERDPWCDLVNSESEIPFPPNGGWMVDPNEMWAFSCVYLC
jgi:hypothetical protein